MEVISGWGNYPRVECEVVRAWSPDQIPKLLKKTSIARGCGRSYADQSLNRNGRVIETTGLDMFLDFNPETGELQVEAGVTLEEILKVFLPRGWFLPVTPGTKYVTVGGAVASDVHGKNHHREGSFSNFLSEITLLTPRGDVRRLTPESDLFWATTGGMGLTGFILSVKFKLRKVHTSYIRYKAIRVEDIHVMMASFEENDPKYTYSVAWIDCLSSGRNLGRGVVMFGEHAEVDELPPKLSAKPLVYISKKKFTFPFEAPGFLLNDLTMKAFNTLYYITHPSYEGFVDYERFFYPLDSILKWNRAYGKRGFVQFQFVVPDSGVMVEVLEEIVRRGGGSFLAVLKRMGVQKGYLPFGMPGWTLALDFPIKPGLFDFLKPLMWKVVDSGGRFYLTKDALMDEGLFKASYPDFSKWYDIRRSVDPDAVLASDLAKRLGMV